MPLPLIIGVAAAAAAATGVGSGIHGAAKMKKANDTMKSADALHKRNLERLEKQNQKTSQDMDTLGNLELKILKSFDMFSEAIEKIQNRPSFKEINRDGLTVPQYSPEQIKKVSVGAGVLLGGIGGAAMGTAGGFAAAGATTAAVMALGTASTGTAIASLSGVAATNATLAALGGGAIAAGGGGIALGTTVLGAATLGVGLLVGGVIFSITGSSLSKKADEAWEQMKKVEREIDRICSYMQDLSKVAIDHRGALAKVNGVYKSHLNRLCDITGSLGETDWGRLTSEEKLCVENCVLLVSLLYSMCKVQLVLKSDSQNDLNRVNSNDVYRSIFQANQILSSVESSEK